MRLENYNVAAYEDFAVADEPVAAAASSTVEAAPVAEVPSTLLSEMAQQAPVFALPPPPAPVASDPVPVDTPPQSSANTSQQHAEGDTSTADAMVKPLASAAEAPTPTPPTWQGMNLPSAAPSPTGAAPSPWPGVDAETFARIEAMGSRDSSAGGGRGSSFGGFGFGGGGFGGGGDVETWDYTFEGIDGAPDTTVSVTYQGENPISSLTTTTLPSSGAGVSEMPQEFITVPAPVDISDLSSELPSWSGGAPEAAGTTMTAPEPAATPTAPNWSAEAGSAGGNSAGSGVSNASDGGGATGQASQGGSAAAGDAAPSNGAQSQQPQESQQGNVIGKNSSGQDIRAVGSYQAQGEVKVVNDMPALRAGDVNISADATGATPMRDEAGTLLYRIDGGKDDGVIRQIIPPGTPTTTAPSTPVEHLDTVVITGRRDPNAPAGGDLDEDLPSQANAATLTLDAAGMASNAARSSSAVTSVMARLAPAARAALMAELEFGPPQLKALALGSLTAGAALAAWQARNGATERDMLTPEEQAEASQPLINLPPPPQPSSPPPLLPTPADPKDSILAGQPIDQPRGPTIEVLPAHEQNWRDLIITSNALNDGDRYGNIPGEDRWRYDRYLNETTNPNPLGPDAWYDKAQTAWQNNSAGNDFELAVRTKLDTPFGPGSKPVNIDGYIPDLPVGPRFGVTDVKNWVNLTNSDQLQSFYEYAKNNDMPFNVIVSPRTESISAPLLDNIRATGGSVVEFDPANNRFTPVDIGKSGPWTRGKP